MPDIQLWKNKKKKKDESLEEKIRQELWDWNNYNLNKGAKKNRNWKENNEKRDSKCMIRNC